MLAGLYSQSLVVLADEAIKPAAIKYDHGVLAEVDPAIPIMAEPAPLIVPEEKIDATLKISRLGNFEKQVLVFVTDNISLHLADPELELLSKMLQAVKLSLADIALINTAKQSISWNEVINDMPAKAVILFGVEPSSIGIPMRLPHFRVHRWNDASFVHSPSLADINAPSPDQTKWKKDLWKALQEVFILS